MSERGELWEVFVRPRRGLAHGDLNPANILRHRPGGSEAGGGPAGWSAIDPVEADRIGRLDQHSVARAQHPHPQPVVLGQGHVLGSQSALRDRPWHF